MVKAIAILMVEDNPIDIRLTQECFRGNKIGNNLCVVNNDADLLAFLGQQGKYAQSSYPDVILFSLALLLQWGYSIFAEIKQHSVLGHIPLVVLTAFDGEENALPDLSNIDLCVSKPLTLKKIMTIVEHIEEFGLRVIKMAADDALRSMH